MRHDSVSVELRSVHLDAATVNPGRDGSASGSSRSPPANSSVLATISASAPQVPLGDFDALEWGQQLNGPTDAESFSIGLPAQENVTSVVPSLKFPYMNRWRAAACLIGYFTQGLNDSVVGALLPYMECQYHISYAVVSILFMARTLGFLSAGPLTHKLNNRFGRSKTLATCAASNMLAFVLITTSPPYPLVALAFYLSGNEHIRNLSLRC